MYTYRKVHRGTNVTPNLCTTARVSLECSNKPAVLLDTHELPPAFEEQSRPERTKVLVRRNTG